MIRFSTLPTRVRRLARDPGAHGGRWQLLYSWTIVTLVIGIPIFWGIAHGLMHPEILPLLVDPPRSLPAVVVAGAMVIMLAMGSTIGPAVLRPFLTVHLAGNHLSRAHTLLQPFLIAAIGIVSVCVVLMGTTVWALWTTNEIGVGDALSHLVVTACIAWVSAVAWLFGQAFDVVPRSLATVGVVILGIFSVLLPGSEQVSGHPILAWNGLPLWCGAALLAAAAVPWILTRLHGPELLDQAHRRDSAVVAGSAGELGQALETFRPLPQTGRRIDAIRAGLPFPLTIAYRDLVGGLRTPLRGAVSLAGVLGAAVLIVTAFMVPAELVWLPAIPAAVLGFASLGVMSDGFRNVAESAGRPGLFNATPAAMIAAHGVLPGAVVMVACICASVVGGIMGAPHAAALTATVCLGLLVFVRASDCARGPLPAHLLTPIPSPVGDASGVRVVMWQIEGLTRSLAIVVSFVYAVRAAPGVLLAAVAVAVVLVVITQRRLRVTA